MHFQNFEFCGNSTDGPQGIRPPQHSILALSEGAPCLGISRHLLFCISFAEPRHFFQSNHPSQQLKASSASQGRMAVPNPAKMLGIFRTHVELIQFLQLQKNAKSL